MMTQQISNVPSTTEAGGRRSERNVTPRMGGLEAAPDVGFDDMNIPGWSSYVEARTAALRRVARLGEVSRESSADGSVVDLCSFRTGLGSE